MRLAQSTAAMRADLGLAGVGVVVLHVMPDRAVVHDVIQLDHAGIRRAKPPRCSSAAMSSSIGVTT